MTRIILYSILFLGIGFASGKSWERYQRLENFHELYGSWMVCEGKLNAVAGSLHEVIEQARAMDLAWQKLSRKKNSKRRAI